MGLVYFLFFIFYFVSSLGRHKLSVLFFSCVSLKVFLLPRLNLFLIFYIRSLKSLRSLNIEKNKIKLAKDVNPENIEALKSFLLEKYCKT